MFQNRVHDFDFVPSHISESFRAAGRFLEFDVNLELPPSITVPETYPESESDFPFRKYFAETLELILRYNHRFFSADHHLSNCLPGIEARRKMEIGLRIEQLSDLYFDLSVDGARLAFC